MTYESKAAKQPTSCTTCRAATARYTGAEGRPRGAQEQSKIRTFSQGRSERTSIHEAGRSAQAYTRSIHEESCRSNLGTHVAPHNHDAAQREEGKDVEADLERQEAQQVVPRRKGRVEAGA